MNSLSVPSATSLANAGRSRDPLPTQWIERIFSKLSGFYGSQFASKWVDCDLAEVKATWAHELAGFRDKPNCIADALKSVTESKYPPNLPEFIEACRTAAKRDTVSIPALPAPLSKAEAEKVFAEVARRAEPAPVTGYDGKLWAKKLRDRYLAGEHLLHIQISMASEALEEIWSNRQCVAKQVAA